MLNEVNVVLIKGIIESGVGEGAFFTQLNWFVEQVEKLLGFKPFPGTLNVRILDEENEKLEMFCSDKGVKVVPNNPEYCSAGLKKVWINGIPGAAVFPEEKVNVHGKSIIEIVAKDHLKTILHLKDGDTVTISDQLPNGV